ncbi:OmpA family protein [Belliella sp. R4-6]|uniref:OmpA family protein n=1 Tax=Belliella alkalica TaxID=1730871 RepID=A0ABS9VAQ0_9BACT|nr:OmpA family protein [Belliella alkalica]MCH7413516.1 OmpA family protein [Belliella alkalica]
MKKILIILILLAFHEELAAQNNVGQRVIQRSKDQTTQRAESKSEQGVDKALNKIEEGIGSIFRKRDKKNSRQETQADEDYEVSSSENSQQQQQVELPVRGNQQRNINSKFDFVSGEKVIAYENFENVAMGDFPVDWNTDSGGEIVRFEGSDMNWLLPAKSGVFVPDFINKLPVNFTLEFSITVSEDFSNSMGGMKTIFVETMPDRMAYDIHWSAETQVLVDIHPLPEGIQYSYFAKSKTGTELRNQGGKSGDYLAEYRVSMWRQGPRLRVYIDDEKIYDLPRAFSDGVDYSLLFGTNYWSGDLFFADLKIAAGEPDTRSKLITEGKFVTNSITFDVNSDVLKNSSYGVLKEIAETLQQNAGVNVQIIGHTDSDGSESLNLDLSKRRAAAVKTALVNDFGIAASRLETDGKGQSEPVAPNNTSAGKAQNRRVEFIKL